VVRASVAALLLLLAAGAAGVYTTLLPAETAIPPELAAIKQAATRGDANAQFELAVLYEYGRGMPHHLAEAYCWYVRAAEQGDARAAEQRDALQKQLTPEEIARCDANTRVTRIAAVVDQGTVADFSKPIRLAQDPQLPPT